MTAILYHKLNATHLQRLWPNGMSKIYFDCIANFSFVNSVGAIVGMKLEHLP